MPELFAGRAGWVVFTLLLLALFLFNWVADGLLKVFSANPPIAGAQLGWLLGLVIVSLGVLVAGIAVNGRWSGVFIDSRNRYSMSQVQAVVWLILISSGIVAAGVGNVQRGDASPLDFEIPSELLAIVGLSLTSLVGGPIIRSVKRQNTPEEDQTQRTVTKLAGMTGNSTASISTEGTVVTLADPRQTGWADLVRGEETGNADKIDLGKLQLLYVSTVAIFVYAAALFTNFDPGPPTDSTATARLIFPAIDASFVGILGLSHAGALAYLAAPHAKTREPELPGANPGGGR